MNLQLLSARALTVGGVIQMGMGLYFVFLRPPLLPEDLMFMDANLAEVQAAMPGLVTWLEHVFGVLGGFIFASGLPTVYIAATAFKPGRLGALAVIAISGFASIGWMAITNFVIDSDFKWLLLALTFPWLIALGSSIMANGPNDDASE